MGEGRAFFLLLNLVISIIYYARICVWTNVAWFSDTLARHLTIHQANQGESGSETHSQVQNAPNKRSSTARIHHACHNCFKSKIRCDGERPCFRCKERNITCEYHERASKRHRSLSNLMNIGILAPGGVQPRGMSGQVSMVSREGTSEDRDSGSGDDGEVAGALLNMAKSDLKGTGRGGDEGFPTGGVDPLSSYLPNSMEPASGMANVVSRVPGGLSVPAPENRACSVDPSSHHMFAGVSTADGPLGLQPNAQYLHPQSQLIMPIAHGHVDNTGTQIPSLGNQHHHQQLLHVSQYQNVHIPNQQGGNPSAFAGDNSIFPPNSYPQAKLSSTGDRSDLELETILFGEEHFDFFVNWTPGFQGPFGGLPSGSNVPSFPNTAPLAQQPFAQILPPPSITSTMDRNTHPIYPNYQTPLQSPPPPIILRIPNAYNYSHNPGTAKDQNQHQSASSQPRKTAKKEAETTSKACFHPSESPPLRPEKSSSSSSSGKPAEEKSREQLSFPNPLSPVQPTETLNDDMFSNADSIDLLHVPTVPQAFHKRLQDLLHECRNDFRPWGNQMPIEVPPLNALNAFVQLYFEYFHPLLPFIHVPSYDPSTTHWLLTLGLVCVGSRYYPRNGTGGESGSLCGYDCVTFGLQELLRRGIQITVSKTLHLKGFISGILRRFLLFFHR